MDMIERVARALAEDGHLGVSLAFAPVRETDDGIILALKERDTERAIAAARAAIEAMREPTDTMKVAGGIVAENRLFGGDAAPTDTIFDDAAAMFVAMIDAALTHKGE